MVIREKKGKCLGQSLSSLGGCVGHALNVSILLKYLWKPNLKELARGLAG